VVWADEPTGNLDTEATDQVMDLLVQMNGEGQTIVLVTHNPRVAARTARTVRMRDGRIEQPLRPPRRRGRGSGGLQDLWRRLRSAWGPARA
jgi:ABC-type lipoprotein export system ATPase subunit